VSAPLLSAVVVHWHGEEELEALVRAWPADPRCELIVVDNGSRRPLPAGPYRLLAPGVNLGFGGGANAGARAARAPLLLFLNPDARPDPGALEQLLEGFTLHPEAAGLAPRLLGDDGRPQYRWQLRPLPRPGGLALQALLPLAAAGPHHEPLAGTAVAQPAAAALALRRNAFEAAGGFDAGFYPAWFEDVDLGRRLAAAGAAILYWPAAAFRHRLGATVPGLGYGPFLWIYSRNLCRYLAKHHGRGWAAAARALTVPGMLGRLLLLPLRRPRRAGGRGEAARGLVAVALGAASGWRWPRSWAGRFAPPAPEGEGR
jgi:N-acetylglucosaminyl-diphospho-decaprenol L-rhamnosyltransferase